MAEIRQLAAQGVREVTLLGQNVNGYRGPTAFEGETADLAALIHQVAAVDGIERIRFTTSHPREFSDRLIEAYATVPKLANHLHLPVQSGSDRILSLMKRGYTALEFRQKIRRLRTVRPDISVSTDFIVGFPGETDDDFAATMQLIADIGFDQSFSFVYSARPGTPAAALPDAVPEAEKLARLWTGHPTESAFVGRVTQADPRRHPNANGAAGKGALDEGLLGRSGDGGQVATSRSCGVTRIGP
jgi:tRNA-2-methylthio-N6-dimethylallyladenosine synthase